MGVVLARGEAMAGKQGRWGSGTLVPELEPWKPVSQLGGNQAPRAAELVGRPEPQSSGPSHLKQLQNAQLSLRKVITANPPDSVLLTVKSFPKLTAMTT